MEINPSLFQNMSLVIKKRGKKKEHAMSLLLQVEHPWAMAKQAAISLQHQPINAFQSKHVGVDQGMFTALWAAAIPAGTSLISPKIQRC